MTNNTTESYTLTALVPITQLVISDEQEAAVDARDLHAFLETTYKFTDWVKARIRNSIFEEGTDFVTVQRQADDDTVFGGKRKTTDVYLTLGVAKEIAMMENNAKGSEVRRYFIDYEKNAKKQLQLIAERAKQLVEEAQSVADLRVKALAYATVDEFRDIQVGRMLTPPEGASFLEWAELMRSRSQDRPIYQRDIEDALVNLGYATRERKWRKRDSRAQDYINIRPTEKAAEWLYVAPLVPTVDDPRTEELRLSQAGIYFLSRIVIKEVLGGSVQTHKTMRMNFGMELFRRGTAMKPIEESDCSAILRGAIERYAAHKGIPLDHFGALPSIAPPQHFLTRIDDSGMCAEDFV